MTHLKNLKTSFYLILTIFSLIFASTHGKCTDEITDAPIHGILLRASLPSNHIAHFVPTHHTTPLSAFTEEFRTSVFANKTLVLESVSIIELQSPEENPGDASLNLLMRYASREYLAENGGFLQPEDPQWSFGDDIATRTAYEQLFMKVHLLIQSSGVPMDLSHFHNIYVMKPGVVFLLYYRLNGFMEGHQALGMDQEISAHFRTKDSQLPLGVETQDDVIASMRTFTATFEDIEDDFRDCHIGSYFSSLTSLHNDALKEWAMKRLMGEQSLAIRNINWMPKLKNDIIPSHEDVLGVFGQFHFVGRQGLISLGQSEGWRWEILMEDGSYQEFTYDPDAEEPFSDKLGAPLKI